MLDFDQFCAKQFVPFEMRAKFKSWLGDKANLKFTERDWLILWTEFLKSQMGFE